jgi:putative redox protein
MTSKVTYTSGLRTQATHIKSGNTIVTDAPTDNHGKGEAFSPTDLFATSLASCAMTIMGIAANTHGLDIDGTTCEVLKIMGDNPRRVSGIDVKMIMPNINYDDKEKSILKHAAHNCPVMKSIHPDIVVNLTIEWHEQ